jgi:hypothetical protein
MRQHEVQFDLGVPDADRQIVLVALMFSPPAAALEGEAVVIAFSSGSTAAGKRRVGAPRPAPARRIAYRRASPGAARA